MLSAPIVLLTFFGTTARFISYCKKDNMVSLTKIFIDEPCQVEIPTIREDSILEVSDYDSYHSRHILQHSNKNLRNVTITGFCSAKSMIEFTNDILAHAPILECLILDTSRGHERKIHKSTICLHMFEEDLVEVQRARMAIERHVVGNVPPTVNLKVIEPCSKCLS